MFEHVPPITGWLPQWDFVGFEGHLHMWLDLISRLYYEYMIDWGWKATKRIDWVSVVISSNCPVRSTEDSSVVYMWVQGPDFIHELNSNLMSISFRIAEWEQGNLIQLELHTWHVNCESQYFVGKMRFPHHNSRGYDQSHDIFLFDEMEEQIVDSDARYSGSLLGKRNCTISLDYSLHPVESVHT